MTVLGSAPDATADTARIKSYARAAAEAGLHLLLIEPGSKHPVDMRSSVQKRKDDEAAAQEARAAGRPDWSKVRSKAGVYLATDNTTLLDRYVEAYRKTWPDEAVNLAVAVGPSRLIVADCDTAEQVAAFLHDFGAPEGVAPTVTSPGAMRDGHWIHSGGGHFYFMVPEDVELDPGAGALTAAGGYTVMWGGRYVLIPPSVRPEGAYRLTGEVFPATAAATDQIRALIRDRTGQRAAQRSARGERNSDLANSVHAWARTVSWADLLAPHGWSPTARPDSCGCAVWTAPGDHASPKSATAHDGECTLGVYTPDNAPLHIWTDHPGGGLEEWIRAGGRATMSRLQVAAALEHGGDLSAAMTAAGISSSDLAFGGDPAAQDGLTGTNVDAPVEDAAEVIPNSPEFPKSSPADDVADDEPSDDPDEELRELVAGCPRIVPFGRLRNTPPPEFAIEGLIENQGLTSLLGHPGVGKTAVALDMASCIVQGIPWFGRRTMRQRVLYLPGEGVAGAVQRLKAWESKRDRDLSDDLFMAQNIIQVQATKEAWAEMIRQIMEHHIGLVIVDTFARASVGMEENSATDVNKAIYRFKQVQERTGAGIMVLHHTTKTSTSSRGSSALQGALESELVVVDRDRDDDDAEGKPIGLIVQKQKNAEHDRDSVAHNMLLHPHDDSVVVTGPSGETGNLQDTIASPKAVIPETLVETALRVAEFVERFPAQGATRGECVLGVTPDAWTLNLRDAKARWKVKIGEAVDWGLTNGVLQTLSGTASGSRYVPGMVTASQARLMWAQQGVSD